MNYPKGERVWLLARDAAGATLYIITSKPSRDMYYLYTPTPDGGWRRWDKDPSAGKLADKFEARRKASRRGGD